MSPDGCNKAPPVFAMAGGAYTFENQRYQRGKNLVHMEHDWVTNDVKESAYCANCGIDANEPAAKNPCGTQGA